MALSFQPVILDGTAPDREAVLVFRDDHLLAVLTCLSDIHDDLAGRWFVEAKFGDVPVGQSPIFESKSHFEDWVTKTAAGTEG